MPLVIIVGGFLLYYFWAWVPLVAVILLAITFAAKDDFKTVKFLWKSAKDHYSRSEPKERMIGLSLLAVIVFAIMSALSHLIPSPHEKIDYRAIAESVRREQAKNSTLPLPPEKIKQGASLYNAAKKIESGGGY